MTLTKKLLLGAAAIGLAGLTALAAGAAKECGESCPKSCPACSQTCPGC